MWTEGGREKTPRSVIWCFLIKILRPISISKSGLPTCCRRFDNALRTAHALVDVQQERERKKMQSCLRAAQHVFHRGYVWWWSSAAAVKKLSCRVLVQTINDGLILCTSFMQTVCWSDLRKTSSKVSTTAVQISNRRETWLLNSQFVHCWGFFSSIWKMFGRKNCEKCGWKLQMKCPVCTQPNTFKQLESENLAFFFPPQLINRLSDHFNSWQLRVEPASCY